MTTNALHLHLLTEDHLLFGHRRPPKGYLIETKDANNLRTTMMKGMTMMNKEDDCKGNLTIRTRGSNTCKGKPKRIL
jgi:hypothetical protein